MKEKLVVDRIAIIGSGLAGSTAALELAKKDVTDITIYERRPKGSTDNTRSEVTLPAEIYQINAEASINTPISNVLFISLDDGKEVELSVSPDSNSSLDYPAVSINHTQLIRALHEQLATSPSTNIKFETTVTKIKETDHGVEVTDSQGNNEVYSHVIDASGASWKNLPFDNPKRQQQFEESLVAIAYGKRCRGKILVPGGEKMFLTPQSARLGTGKISWVVSAGDGQLEVVFSDYSRRKDVGKVNGKERYELLRDILISRGIVEIEDEGETIAGYYDLEPRRTKTGNKRVFHHGEKGQYTAASTGDSISTTIRLSPILAELIANGENADAYFTANGKMFNHRLEMAAIMAKYHANTVGGGIDIIKAVQKLSIPEQHEFIRTHKFPLKYLPETIIRNPHLLLFVRDLGREYIAQLLKRG